MVLFATVHGVIPIITTTDASGQPKQEVGTFLVPKGMRITRVMATLPGVCNMTTNDEIEKFVKMLHDMAPEIETNKDLTDEQLQQLQRRMQKEYSDILGSVQQQIKSVEDKDLYLEFVRSSISKLVLQRFGEQQPILEKFLARQSNEGVDTKHDYKLNIINMRNIPDIFDRVISISSGKYATRAAVASEGSGIWLSELVYRLQTLGVTNLIFVDFTCSSFEDGVLTDRGARIVRRDTITKGRGRRKRTRRSNNKTKTRRGKKRTVSKWRR
jgi:hypothetical protein